MLILTEQKAATSLATLVRDAAHSLELSIMPAQIEKLRLAGAPTKVDELQVYLAERFGVTLSAARLRQLAAVPPEMLIPPAERGRTKGRGT